MLPSASNVAVALTQAQINEDSNSPNFLQQDLDNVYTYTDPRSYPLSSYSYLIVPKEGTAIPPIFGNSVGASLSITSTSTCAQASNRPRPRLLPATAQPR